MAIRIKWMLIVRGSLPSFLPTQNRTYFAAGHSCVGDMFGSGSGEFAYSNVYVLQGSGRGTTYNRIYHFTDCRVDISCTSKDVPRCPY